MTPVPFPADITAVPAQFELEPLPDFGEPRTDHDVLVSIADILVRQTAVLEHLLARLGSSSDSRSSVEVKTSTRGVDISSKSYDGSDVCGQVDPAVQAYFEAMRQVQERVNEGTGK